MSVQALFVDMQGVYPRLLGADACWGEERDARTFDGPGPVVTHPPCARWSRLAASVYARTRKDEHRPGNDGGCFEFALASIRRCGGVLEHPAESKAWGQFGLTRPTWSGWRLVDGIWQCEVWQVAYGHPARKRTWLAYCGDNAPDELDWARDLGAHTAVVGHDTRRPGDLPRLQRRAASATPEPFARALIALAEGARSPRPRPQGAGERT